MAQHATRRTAKIEADFHACVMLLGRSDQAASIE
jgi:hypothetical protein